MANPVGSFIWYELMTPAPEVAATFYAAVVGWRIVGDPQPPEGGIDYRHILRSDGGNAGGVLRLTREMIAGGALPCWLPYLHVRDADEAVAAISADGGTLLMPAFDLPVGRIAMLSDPQGVPIYVMAPVPPAGRADHTSDVFSPSALQRVGWNELASPDPEASRRFYSRRFGFEFNESMPMGALGDYAFIDHHGQRLGAILRARDEDGPAGWRIYFRVPSIAAAKRAIEANGGRVRVGPHEVPTGDWILVGSDPQGAVFGLVGAKG